MSKLLLDLGNTRIKASVYKNKKIQARKSFDYDNLNIFFEYIEQLTNNYNKAVISNVKEKKIFKNGVKFFGAKKNNI